MRHFVLATAALAAPFEGPRGSVLAGLDRTDGAPGAGAVDGFFYGAQIGYDLRTGPVVIGGEFDVGGSTASSQPGGTRSEQGLFANVALRIGVPLGDKALPFIRGGYAYHEVDRTGVADIASSGYTAGAGVEYAVTDRLFLRGEYRFSDYGDDLRGQQALIGGGLRF